MKTKALRAWAAVGLSVLTATAAYRASADDVSAKATTAKPDKTYTGTVVSVNPKENMLDVKGFWFSNKKLNLGSACTYSIVGQENGTIGDLRPGQKVRVAYQDAHGVLIADRVSQEPMRDVGMVKSIDPVAHTMTLHVGAFDKTFQLPADCDVTLRGGKSGTIVDIQPGYHVTVTYEVPNGKATAREIAQTSATFTGDMTAIDLDQKTIRAKSMFDMKRFNVGNDCAILVNGKPDGKLTDLRPGEKLTFSYDDVNGVNVATRIAPAGTSTPSSVAEK